jgi:hypothetical protein
VTDTAAPTAPAPNPAEVEVLDELTTIADRLDELKALYERRTVLWARARAMDPPIVQRRLAEASRVNEVMIIKALKRDAAATEAAAEG